MEKIETVRMSIDPSIVKEAENLNGSLGKVCNNCGGYGFTMKLGGGKLPCMDCRKTGVAEMSKDQLQDQVVALTKDLALLKNALLETLRGRGVAIPTDPKEQLHA